MYVLVCLVRPLWHEEGVMIHHSYTILGAHPWPSLSHIHVQCVGVCTYTSYCQNVYYTHSSSLYFGTLTELWVFYIRVSCFAYSYCLSPFPSPSLSHRHRLADHETEIVDLEARLEKVSCTLFHTFLVGTFTSTCDNCRHVTIHVQFTYYIYTNCTTIILTHIVMMQYIYKVPTFCGTHT